MGDDIGKASVLWNQIQGVTGIKQIIQIFYANCDSVNGQYPYCGGLEQVGSVCSVFVSLE